MDLYDLIEFGRRYPNLTGVGCVLGLLLVWGGVTWVFGKLCGKFLNGKPEDE